MSGYFDGDGNIEELIGHYVISIRIGFSDNWDEQLLAVRGFLNRNGVMAGGLTRTKFRHANSAWQLRITNLAGILEMAK